MAPAFDLILLREWRVDDRDGDVARRSTHSTVTTGGANDGRELLWPSRGIAETPCEMVDASET